MRLGKGTGVALLVLAAGWVAAQQGSDVQQVTGFRVPSYDDQGLMTSQMFGDAARIMTNGLVEISELRMEFYARGNADRQMEMRVTSPKCLYDRSTSSATSEAPVRIARDNMVVTGTGFVWDGKKERLQIMTDAKVVLKDVKRSMKEVSP